ncbi:MAG: Type 1 glutamine amidotransferase-like domain-containing protein [Actinomycetota bacterium]
MSAGLLCLQGGRELTSECREMDAAVLDRTDDPVVVLAGAARPGTDYAGASARASAHYAALGAEVVVAPDPRDDLPGCLDALTEVGLLVLPGGSPGSLLGVVSGPVGDRIGELHRGGAAISGASAGAMVLCDRLVVPDRGGEPVDGLGFVPGLALPHWSATGGPRWRVAVEPRWGLPECGGVLIDATTVLAVGRGEPSILLDGATVAIPREPVALDLVIGRGDSGRDAH